MTDVQRDLGYHDAKIESLELELRGLREDFGEMRADIAEMRRTFEQARGSVKVLVAVATIGAAIGGIVVKIMVMLKGGQ